MAEESARCTEQQFFWGVLGQKPFQLGRQMAGALLFVSGNGISHGLAQEVSGPLATGCGSLADGGAGGVAEGEIQQDIALPVRVMGGKDIDGQHSIESLAKHSQRAPRSLRALQS